VNDRRMPYPDEIAIPTFPGPSTTRFALLCTCGAYIINRQNLGGGGTWTDADLPVKPQQRRCQNDHIMYIPTRLLT
jgi:hypothetical protein